MAHCSASFHGAVSRRRRQGIPGVAAFGNAVACLLRAVSFQKFAILGAFSTIEQASAISSPDRFTQREKASVTRPTPAGSGTAGVQAGKAMSRTPGKAR